MSKISASEVPAPAAPALAPRRRAVRSDARRNTGRILAAAQRVLAADPDAGLAAVAAEAGVTRQTVYAHFPNRDALVDALADRVTARVVAALDAAGLDDLPATAAVARVVEVAWDVFDASRVLALGAGSATPDDEARHAPVVRRLTDVVERGRRDGTFDPALPADWVVATALALGHAAGQQVAAGRLAAADARALLLRTLERALGAS